MAQLDLFLCGDTKDERLSNGFLNLPCTIYGWGAWRRRKKEVELYSESAGLTDVSRKDESTVVKESLSLGPHAVYGCGMEEEEDVW